MLRIYYRTIRDHATHILDTFRVGVWVHIEDPTAEDIDRIKEKYALDESLLADAADQYEVPRMEIEDGILYIFSRYPIKKGPHISTSPILFIITKDAVITITKERFVLVEDFSKRSVFFTTQKTKLFLQLFTLINNSFNLYLHNISRQIGSAYDLEKISNRDIVQFVNYERILNEFHLALVRTNLVHNMLLSHNYLKMYEEDRDLLEDLSLSNDQLILLSSENLKSIRNIRDAYSTIITQNTNRVMRFFTSATVILTIPTIVGSIYGMNVRLPYDSHPLAFFGILLFIIILCAVFVVMFLKNDWL